ncbi:MFS transporter [Rickettsiales bacterium LUAb2]
MDILYKNRRLLILSKFFSDLGGYSSLVIFPAYIFLLTGNVLYISLFLVCRVIGSFVGGLCASYILHSKTQYVLIIADISRAFIIIIFIFSVNKNNFDSVILVILILAFLLGFGQAIYNIGINSNIPKLVAEHYITKINVNLSVASSIAVVASGLIAATGLLIFGYRGIFIWITVFYVCSSLLVYALNFQYMTIKKIIKKNNRLLESFGLLKKEPFILMMMVLTFIDTLASGSHNVGRPVLAAQINHAQLGIYAALLLSTWAIGKIFGAIYTKKIITTSTPNKLIPYFIMGVFVMSSSFIIAYNIPIVMLIFVFLLLAGLGDGIAEVSFISRLQKLDEGIRLAAFSWVSMAQTIGFAAGLTLAGLALQVMSLGNTIIMFHIVPIITCLCVFFSYLFFKIKLEQNNP